MEALLVSAGVVALAEIGDKTQFLALLLAARFRAPVPVICGILSATLVNHCAAGAVGTLLAASISPAVMRYLLAASFLATALWMLIPDRPLAAVVAGTTLGMMLADVPVVLLGEAAAKRLPLRWAHRAAAGAFIVLALLVLFGVRL